MKIPSEVKFIIEALNKSGFEAYIVGGCVRDYILGKTPKDWDITTSALPTEAKELFEHTFDTGIQHGTITVVLNKQNFEVTTYRIDGDYKDSRHPESVTFTKNIVEDLSRRDFTMNAIAFNENEGFVDPFDGIGDIKKGVIRGVGNADTRFKEDALRMMRAVRFSAQLNFNIEAETYKAIIENADLIKNISIERIHDEFVKLLLTDNPEKVTLLAKTGLLQHFLPEMNTDEKSIEILKMCNKDVSELFCAILKDFTPKSAIQILKRMKFDNNTIKEVSVILQHINDNLIPDFYVIRKTVSQMGEKLFLKLLNLKKYIKIVNKGDLASFYEIEKIFDEILKNNDCTSLKDLALNGNDLIGLGISGKDIGRLLNSALDIVLKDPTKNNKTDLKQILEL